MFRNPRENASPSIEHPLSPSTGRPPTPPHSWRTANQPPTSAMGSRSSTKPLTPQLNSKSNVPPLSRQITRKIVPGKAHVKSNTSILNFFKKVDSPLKDDSIFLSQGSEANDIPSRPRLPTPDLDTELDDIYGDGDNPDERFNEAGGPLKRRKTSNGSAQSTGGHNSKKDGDTKASNGSSLLDRASTPPPTENLIKARSKNPRRTGPFLSDSDTDDELDNQVMDKTAVDGQNSELGGVVSRQLKDTNDLTEAKSEYPPVPLIDLVGPDAAWRAQRRVPVGEAQSRWEALQPRNKVHDDGQASTDDNNGVEDSAAKVINFPCESGSGGKIVQLNPSLKEESMSIDEWGRFDNIDDFPDDDEFANGEEFIERKWMEEQARLEADDEGHDEEPFNGFEDDAFVKELPDAGMTGECPICDASLGGITPDEATEHVNRCLDGNPIPLPEPAKTDTSEVKLMPPGANNRFARRAAIARPGQANPFEIGSVEGTTSNYFSKLMSGKAEDAAWASAAAAEQASRGKPAYQRICPFYKIMPGFFICVDAFRYGAVQGCNAYFLSHFHSDHYIGLTSSWRHGPIYCSKVTANLVKQQLRVDPEWVVALDFEERFEVPGTQGVAVTMIPANHCPGSSLFLFEKVVRGGSNPKIQRVLHCGDFRACPAHTTHPLLMPDIVDSISGRTKQQKIDVCYLDTTYLNPRYSFPCQEDVINACADMCVSLKKERAEESDAWEVVKRERAGTGMAKFISAAIKPEEDSIAMEIGSKKMRGRLLVVCGTYSIGKERICMGIAKALDCKIWAPPGKMRICAALEDPELMSRMTDDPREAQIHMQMLMEIRAETLQDYLNGYKPHFSRIVGFRPSGWNYRPPNSRFTDSPSIPTVLHSENWKSNYTMAELVPQRGSTREASCFGVPYSEHSSFRELTMFVCALRIEKVVPTVNVGSAAGRAKMKAWIERWLAERRKNGCVKIGDAEGEVRW